ncbi:metal-dependent transcriptional regulator [Tenacibaculum sp. 190524A02b]
MFSQSEENYIKTIYHISTTSNKGISTNAIAKKLNTKASSVTDMIKKLSEKKVVVYKKYQGVNLTEFGKKTAINIIRKHRLWEVFLVEKLNFSWDEVHEVAEQLEHIKSPKLIDELDKFLGFPKSDPHGTPIPDKDGNIIIQQKTPLNLLDIGYEGKILSVRNSSDNFLRYLNKKNIAIGQNIKVITKEPFDKTVIIDINGKEITLIDEVASNLLISN